MSGAVICLCAWHQYLNSGLYVGICIFMVLLVVTSIVAHLLHRAWLQESMLQILLGANDCGTIAISMLRLQWHDAMHREQRPLRRRPQLPPLPWPPPPPLRGPTAYWLAGAPPGLVASSCF